MSHSDYQDDNDLESQDMPLIQQVMPPVLEQIAGPSFPAVGGLQPDCLSEIIADGDLRTCVARVSRVQKPRKNLTPVEGNVLEH